MRRTVTHYREALRSLDTALSIALSYVRSPDDVTPPVRPEESEERNVIMHAEETSLLPRVMRGKTRYCSNDGVSPRARGTRDSARLLSPIFMKDCPGDRTVTPETTIEA